MFDRCQRNKSNVLLPSLLFSFFFLFEEEIRATNQKYRRVTFQDGNQPWNSILLQEKIIVAYLISISTIHQEPTLLSFLDLKYLHFSFFFPWGQLYEMSWLMKREQKWSHFLAEKIHFGFSFLFFSVSGTVEQSHPCPEKTHAQTHTKYLCGRDLGVICCTSINLAYSH